MTEAKRALSWLHVRQGRAPLLLSIPHAGTRIPAELADTLRSPWLSRFDTDWYLPQLYAFALGLDATIVRTDLSRTVVDVNRDPGGASLYPGMATTSLCPVSTFDGEALYVDGQAPSEQEIERRRREFHVPYHEALGAELHRLRQHHAHVVLYDAHSIRSRVPRLFDGELPHLNIGTNGARSCDDVLTQQIVSTIGPSRWTHVVNGRFKGGYITRQWGRPAEGLHAVQMEIACRSYLEEPQGPLQPANWPPPFQPEIAAPLQSLLAGVLATCIDFAISRPD